jgi:hypothetical protein
MTINVNAMAIRTYMENTWATNTDTDPGEKIARVLLDTIDWLHKSTRSSYPANGTDKAKLGHFRQLFVVWQATCRKMKGAPWMEVHPNYNYVGAYPMYFKALYPELYIAMYLENVFLGMTFNAAQLDWIELQIEKRNRLHTIQSAVRSIYADGDT